MRARGERRERAFFSGEECGARCAWAVRRAFVGPRPRLTHVIEKGKLSTLREMRPPMSGGPCAMAAGATWYVADYRRVTRGYL